MAGNACIARLCEASQSASGVSHDIYEKTHKESIIHGMETAQAAGAKQYMEEMGHLILVQEELRPYLLREGFLLNDCLS
jgi:hypothetical protein